MENNQNHQNGENQENRENIVENGDPNLVSPPPSGNTDSSQTSSISDFASSGAYRRLESSTTQSSQSPSFTLSSLTSYSRETPTDQKLDALSPSGSTNTDFQGTRFTVKKMLSSELQQQPSSSNSSSDKAPDTPALSPKSVKIVDFIHAPSTSSQAKGIVADLKPNLSFLMSKVRHVLQPKELPSPQSQHSSPINEEIELRSIHNVVGLSDEETTGDLDGSNVPLLNAGLQSENNELLNRASALDARSQDASERTSSDNPAGTMSSPSEGITTNGSIREECYCNRRCVFGCALGYIAGVVTILLILSIWYFAHTVNAIVAAKKSGGSRNGTISANNMTVLPTFDPNGANFSGKHDDKLSDVMLLETQIATTNDSITTISNNTSTDDAPHIDVPKSEIVSSTETSIGKSKRKRNVGN